ncbi:MAG: ABC transporter permease, partial [Gemmatimonadota bacterium]|nr:ABC transporter permease [Gemmatimonadota bacterium]
SEQRAVIRECIGLALEVLRAHRMRSALVILGVAIGVAVLMGMVAVLTGLGQKIEDEITASERPVVTLSKFDFLTEGDPHQEKILARPDVTPEDAAALEDLCESVEMAEFFIDANRGTILHYRDQKTRIVFVAGGGENVPFVYNLPVTVGRYFHDAELLASRNVIVLGHGPAEDLFPILDPVGKRIRLGGEEYEVVGVFAERKSVFGGMSENFAFIPWTTFKKNYGRKHDPYYVYMTIAEGYTAEDVVREATVVMRARHRLAPGEKNDFAAISNDRITEFVQKITGPIGLVLLVMSSIGLTVGGIGVMNIMLVSVTERTREIGIRKALGARRGTILLQFLVEAGTLTGLGGLVGVGLGSVVAWGVGRVAHFPVHISPWIVLGGALFSISIGVFFGLYPAVRGARLDPIEALRYE